MTATQWWYEPGLAGRYRVVATHPHTLTVCDEHGNEREVNRIQWELTMRPCAHATEATNDQRANKAQKVSTMTLIGISGRSGSGKSTIAAHLVTHHGFVSVAFADALRDELRERLPRTLEQLRQALYIVGWNPHYLDIDKMINKKPPVIRPLMQEYGTEVRRRDNPQYWIERWCERVDATKRTVVPDVRFMNEVRHIRSCDGVVIRVERPSLPHSRIDDHVSERELDDYTDFDAVFVNDSTAEALCAKVDGWLASRL